MTRPVLLFHDAADILIGRLYSRSIWVIQLVIHHQAYTQKIEMR